MRNYSDTEIENAVNYLFKLINPMYLSTGEVELADWINDRMLSGDITHRGIPEVKVLLNST